MSEKINNKHQEVESVKVCEPALAYKTPVHQVHMAFDVPQSFDEQSFRHMMVVYAKDIIEQAEEEELPNPMSLEEAMSQGCVDLETARAELHRFVNNLTKEYCLQ